MMLGMSGYTKLFSSILASTIWREDNDTRIVWITMLAMSDKDGIVEASVPGLADLARVSVDGARRSITKLLSPDPDSRSDEQDGRRIEHVEGGWRLVNHAKYRAKMGEEERREYKRRKAEEYRRRGHKVDKSRQTGTNVDRVDTIQKQSTDTKAKEERTTAIAVRTRVRDVGFDAFWAAYPRKVGRGAALLLWQHLKPDDALQARILAALAQQRASEQWLTEGGRFIPHPRTWLSQGRWDDEPVQVPHLNETTVQTLAAGERWLQRRKHRAQEALDVHK